jgi:hypothetical protein
MRPAFPAEQERNEEEDTIEGEPGHRQAGIIRKQVHQEPGFLLNIPRVACRLFGQILQKSDFDQVLYLITAAG